MTTYVVDTHALAIVSVTLAYSSLARVLEGSGI